MKKHIFIFAMFHLLVSTNVVLGDDYAAYVSFRINCKASNLQGHKSPVAECVRKLEEVVSDALGNKSFHEDNGINGGRVLVKSKLLPANSEKQQLYYVVDLGLLVRESQLDAARNLIEKVDDLDELEKTE